MRKILFVDDDPNVLKGLKRILRGMRSEWEMDFVDNAAQALGLLAASDFDVLVSDMRMEKIDGPELLIQVREEYPAMVRIVLSAYSDHKAIMRTVRLAHQYISKPCVAENLKATVEKAFALKHLLASEKLRRLISKMETFPSLPSTYSRITELLHDPDTSVRAVAKVIGEDIGMSLKILQIVNSAFFGLARRMTSAEDAAVFLGIDTIRALVLTIGIFASFEDKGGISKQVVEDIYAHSLKTAALAKTIAIRENLAKDRVEDAYIAGLLHDMGKLIMARHMPKSYGRLYEAAQENKLSIQRAEMQIFGASHEQIGAYLIGLWGLPDSIAETVAFHHVPDQCPASGFDVVGAVHIADAIEHITVQTGRDALKHRLSMAYLDRFGLQDRLEDLIELPSESVN